LLASNQLALAAAKEVARRSSPKEIKTIRALLKTADIPVAEVAAHFGIARSTLYRAVLKPAA
jgi:transposase-like protein